MQAASEMTQKTNMLPRTIPVLRVTFVMEDHLKHCLYFLPLLLTYHAIII